MNRKIYLLFIILFASKMTLNAAVITATLTGNWDAAATWNGPIPGAGDDVIISGGRAVTVIAGTSFTVNSITIGTSANNANSLVMASNTSSLTVTNSITIVPSTIGANARNNVLNVSAGYIICNGLNSSDSGIANKDCNISISTGTLDVNGNATLGTTAAQNAFTFTGGGTFRVSGAFAGGGTITSALGNVEYYGGAQTMNSLFTAYNNLIISNTGIKTLGATSTINGNLLISGTAQLDATATPYNISVAGNWSVTSSNADPFLEQTSRVTFNGAASAQSISTVLAAGETFYNATINNSFGTNPQLATTSDINISNDIDWTAGALDLAGKNLVITGGTATSALSTGTILTTVPGSSITITDPTDTYTVDFNNFTVGTNTTTGAIPVTMTSNSSTWQGSKFYGATNFTKTGIGTDDFIGGNFFYGPSCYFRTTNTAARWRMGNSNPAPDVFYNATFDANGTTVAGATNNNFIVGANSIGNEYYGTTTLISTTPGGFFVGRSNGTGNSSHIFHGPITVSVTATGNVTIGDAGASNTSTVTIENTLALNSSSTSIGDIYVGSSTGHSRLSLTASGQIIDGTILGATNIYFNSINQTNALPLSTISTATTNSTIFIGGLSTSTVNPVAATTCTFNGTTTFVSPNINLRGGIFNSACSFTANGVSTLSSFGGNTFNGTTRIVNTGTGDWNLGYNLADDFNGPVIFIRNSSGILTPASRTNSTFSGNISTVGSNSVVTFCESSTTGTVTIDGNGSQTLSGSSTRIPIIRKLVMNTTAGGSLTLNVPLNISSNLLMTSGNIISTSTNSITLTDETVTSNIGNANSFINGPCYYDVTSNALNSLTFPVGKGTRWRPVILGERNSVNTSITYKAEVINTSARSLGYTMPATVDTVSDFNYWDVDRTLTSTGAALPTQSLTGTQSITLYYLDGDEVKDPSNLRIVKNTSAAPTTWIDIGGTGSGAPAGFITSTSAPSAFTNYSRFTLGDAIGGGNPLPIELLSFTAMKNNKVVDIQWETATEINNDYYEVEKSKNGFDFESFAKIDAAGNSSSKLKYSAIDERPFNGISYYRLKQVDFNGSFSYSKIEAVEFDATKEFSFEVYPNPNKGTNFNMAFEGLSSEEVLVVVYDVTGKESYSKVLVTSENESSVLVIDPTNTLSSGVYIITATSNQEIYRKKLIVE